MTAAPRQTPLTEKVPPYDESAERAALGCCLIDPDAARIVFDDLTADDFYLPRHKTLFTALKKIFEATGNLDEIAVNAELKKQGLFIANLGPGSIAEIIIATSSAAQVETYVQLVQDKAADRQALQVAQNLAQAAQLGNGAAKLAELGLAAPAKSGTTSLAALLKDAALLNPPPRLPSTFTAVDAALNGGFMPGAMYVLAALTGRGKSTLCANVARRVVKSTPVLWFTLEDEDLASARKLVAQESGVPLLALENYKRPGAVTQAEAGRVAAAIQRLTPLPLSIDTTTSDLAAVERAATFHATRGVKVVLIDQSSWLHIPDCEPGCQEASAIARRLKILAKSLKIVLFVLVQVNRQGAAAVRDGQDLELYHIRDSGKWEEDADAVLILQAIQAAGNGDSLLKLDLKKHRHGRAGLRVFLKARLDCGLVEDSPEHLEPEDLSKPKPAAEDEKAAWTEERFINACCAATPETKDAIFARAQDNGLTERKAEKLLNRAVALKKLFVYPRKGNEARTFATLPPPPPKSKEAKPKRPPGRPKKIIREREHTPPRTPTTAQQAPVGAGGVLSVDSLTTNGEPQK